MEKILEKTATWMLNRGWKKIIAKRKDFEQSLFEHTMVELDAINASIMKGNSIIF